MTVVIDTASIDDADAIARVHIASKRAAYQPLLPERAARLVLDPPDAQPGARGWKRWLSWSRVTTLVARVDGAIAGFCTMHPIRNESAPGLAGEISAFYVLPEFWRRGIGRRLGEQILAQAHTRGFAEVFLWVLEANDRAQRFYRSLGFTPDGTRRVFLEHSSCVLHDVRYRHTR